MNESAPPAADGREYAGLGRRLLAALIDNLTWLIGIGWLFGDLIAIVYDASPEVGGMAALVVFSAWFNYFSFCEWRWGQTIGKNATRIEVVGPAGDRPTFAQASMRNLLRLADVLVIGWVMIATDRRRQRLGDKVAKTVVLRRAPKPLPAALRPAAAPVAGSGSPRAGAATPPIVPATSAVAPTPPPAGPETAAAAPSGPRGSLPAIRWSLGDTGWGLLAGLIVAFIVAPALVLPFDPDLDSDGALLVAQGLLGVSLIAVSLGAATRWRFGPLRPALASLGLRGFAPVGLAWMLVAMFAYYLAAGLFASFVIEPDQEDIGGELGVGDENVLIAVAAVVLIAGIAPIAEELFFRGFLFSGLRNRLSLWPAAVIAGLVFGAIHAVTGITTVIPLAALGIALCWLYEKTGSLWPCVIAHTFNNGLALLLIS